MNEYTSHLPQWLLLSYPLVSLSKSRNLWLYRAAKKHKPQVTFCIWIQVTANTEVNNWWHENLAVTVCVCHQSCEIIASRDVWNCSAAVLRIREPVIIRLLSPVTVEIIPQSLHERILVVSIQTTVIQSNKMVSLTKTPSRSHGQRWLSVSLAASLLKSGNSCKKSFSLFQKHTSVCYSELLNIWFIATPLTQWGCSYTALPQYFHLLCCRQ